MSRIEELTDDIDDSRPSRENDPSLIQSAAPLQSTPFPVKEGTISRDIIAPPLPPQMASVRSHTADEIVQMMNRTPLFMTSLDNAAEGYFEEGAHLGLREDGENVGLEAMRALQYEGTPVEIAQGFKEQGNDMVKAKSWKNGKEFYTKGIAVLMQEKKHATNAVDTGSPEPEGAETKKRRELEEACYVNRALCNLELKNYRSTTLDCASALRLNPRNVKAYYRCSSALFALDKLREASDACARGLALDPKNAALAALDRKIKSREETSNIARQKRQQQAERAQKEKSMLATALRARSIRIRNTAQPPDLEDAAIHLAPDPLSPTSALHFPVVLLYPLHAQSDFIKAFPETDTIPQHLDFVFPLPWDEKREYTTGGVEFYMETGIGGLVKVGKNVTLGKVLSSGGMEILDGIVRINVLLKGKTAGWIEEMKLRKGG